MFEPRPRIWHTTSLLWSICEQCRMPIAAYLYHGCNVTSANTTRWYNVGLLLGHSLRRWPNIVSTRPVCWDGIHSIWISRVSTYMLTKCWFNSAPASQTVCQHWANIGSTSLVWIFTYQHMVLQRGNHNLLGYSDPVLVQWAVYYCLLGHWSVSIMSISWS